MTAMDLGRLGVTVDVRADGTHLTAAAEAEALGYGTVWVAGGQLDSLDVLLDLLRVTESVRVAPGIIPLDVYSADDVVQLYRAAEAEAPGRLVVGLGGPQGAERPLRALNTFLDDLDAAGMPRERRVLAALGPRKLALARDRAAGAAPFVVTPTYVADARTRLGVGVLAAQLPVSYGTATAAARDAGRGLLSFLFRVRGYREHMIRQGFHDAELDELPDALVDAVVAHGTPEAIAARVGELRGAGADHVTLGDLGGRGRELARDLVPELALLANPVPG